MMGANCSMVQLTIELMGKGVEPTVLMPSQCGGASSDLGKLSILQSDKNCENRILQKYS